VLAKVQLLLVLNPMLAAGLAQAFRAAAGIIQGIGSVSVFGGLIGTTVSAIRPESPNLARGQGGGNELGGDAEVHEGTLERRPDATLPGLGRRQAKDGRWRADYPQ
jgi:hypothetical protein